MAWHIHFVHCSLEDCVSLLNDIFQDVAFIYVWRSNVMACEKTNGFVHSMVKLVQRLCIDCLESVMKMETNIPMANFFIEFYTEF